MPLAQLGPHRGGGGGGELRDLGDGGLEAHPDLAALLDPHDRVDDLLGVAAVAAGQPQGEREPVAALPHAQVARADAGTPRQLTDRERPGIDVPVGAGLGPRCRHAERINLHRLWRNLFNSIVPRRAGRPAGRMHPCRRSRASQVLPGLQGLPAHQVELFEARLERWWPDLVAGLVGLPRPRGGRPPGGGPGRRRLRRPRRRPPPPRPARSLRSRLVPGALRAGVRRLRRPVRRRPRRAWPTTSTTWAPSA